MTGLRGVAAVYVVLFHYWTGVGFSSRPKTFLSHGYLAVDLFFILSGFVITLNYADVFDGGLHWRSMRLFLTRRLARVYPLYLVTATCAFSLIWIGWLKSDSLDSAALHQFSHAALIRTVMANILMIQTWGIGPSFNSPSWSISTEWAAYLLFPTALWAARDSYSVRTKLSVLMAILWIAVCCWLPSYITHRPHPEALLNLFVYSGGWPVLRCLPEFYLGVVTARLYTQRSNLNRRLSGWTGTAVLLAVLVLLATRWSDLFFVLLCPALILSMTLSEGFVVRLASCGPVRHLGKISYSIYLVHDLLGGLVSSIHRLASQHGLAHGQTYGAVAGIALTYPLSLLAYSLVERPCRNIVRSLSSEAGRA